MSQLTLEDIARRAQRLDDLGVARRPSRSTLRATAPTIAEQFAAFHAAHPEIYALLVKFARDVKARGKSSYGMKAIWERARWHYEFEREGGGYKFNNNFTSHYSRLIEEREEDLRGFFEKRKLRSE